MNNKAAIKKPLNETIEEMREYFENIIALMPGHVYWKDKNGVLQGCNDLQAKSAGLSSRKEIVGKTDYELPWKEQADYIVKVDKEIMKTGISRMVEEVSTLADGTTAIFLSNKVPLRNKNNEIIGLLGISIDITERKTMEEDLRKAREAAEATSRAKSMFLANMSHDIKTPIAGIISTAEYLMHAIKNPEQKSHVDDIEQSGLRLLELMTEVIEVSRLEIQGTSHNHIQFKPRKLLEDIIQLMRPAIINKSLIFNVEYDDQIPSFLLGNRWYLYRIILNLLSNAIKFTDEGGITIKIQLIKQTKKAATLKINVIDTGIGIPKDKQAIIFDEFTRLTPSYEGIYKGTGLGLYIVKQFVESMKGEVYVESEEGKGSIFTCIIPLKKSLLQMNASIHEVNTNTLQDTPVFTQTTLVPTPKPETKQRLVEEEIYLPDNLQILLVEDNKVAARAAKDILQSVGCYVDVASSGKEALNLFEIGKYHLIYMDIGLPDIDGPHVAAKIRELEGNSDNKVPIVALSAHINPEVKATCLQCGMDEVSTKPLLREKAKQIIKMFVHGETEDGHVHEDIHDKTGTSAEQLKIIDLELGASIINSTIEDAKAVLQMIVDTLPETQQEMENAYHAKNMVNLAKSTHKLHGGLSYCGVPRLKLAVKTLEAAARSGHAEKIDELYQTVCSEIKLFMDEYANL